MKKLKRIGLLMFALIIAIGFAGCGNSKKAEESKTVTTKEEPKQKWYFKNNVGEIEDIKVKITKVKVIHPGKPGNAYGEKPVIAFWYKITNKSSKDISAIVGWSAMFRAIQDNSSDFERELSPGALPDDRFLNTQSARIKKGGTVECACAYELSDTKTPVTLIATKGVGGEEIGRIEYKLKKKK